MMVMGVCFSPLLMLCTPMVQTLIQLLFTALQAPHKVLWTPQNHGLVSVSVVLPYCIVLLYGIALYKHALFEHGISIGRGQTHINFVCCGYPWISLHTSTDVM